MLKRKVSILTALIFFITLFPVVFSENAYAYQNNSYFNNIKVGLVSMSSTSQNVTLNGSYTLNGQLYPSGTSFNLGISGTSLTLNGALQSQISLIPTNTTNLLSITNGSVTNKYMGSFLFKLYNSKILPINTIDIESYLKGVVGYEMSDNFPIEALKAQTVAARNFALSRLGWEAAKGYDFDDTTSYQVYKGYNPNYLNVINAVEQTKGQVLLYNDALVETLYSAWHGGVSENSENVWGNYVPYLRSVVDPFENNPWPNGNIILSNSSIQTTLTTKGYLAASDTFIKLDLNSITKYPSGRVSNINIVYKDSTGLQKTKSVTMDSTRTFLALPSNLYTITYDSVNGIYTFSGKGNGHGLGMSQIGAKNRAAAGQTYDTILSFYYQNVYLQNIIAKASLSNVTQSCSALLVGNTISFNATGAGGNGFGYLYKYVVKNGSDIVYTSDYNNNPGLDYIPTTQGNYTVETDVKDSRSISDYDDKKMSSFTAYGGVTLNSFTLNKTNTLVGQPVAANLDIQGGSGSYLYKYEVANAKDNTLLLSRDFSTNKQFSFTPTGSGNYTISVYVKDSLSVNSYDFKQVQSFTAYDSLSFTSFNKDITNVFAGDAVNFSSTTGGGSGKGVSYKYAVLKDGNPVATRDFNANSNYSFVPSAPGNYEVDAYAVDAISDNSFDIISKMNFSVSMRANITNFTIDKTTTFANSTVTLTPIVSDNASGVLYKYVILKNGTAVFTKDFNLSSNLQYTPTTSGSFTVQLYTKDSLSLKDYDDTSSLQFIVYDYSQLGSVAEDKTQLFKNDVIHFSANGINGSGSYLYKFVVMKDNTPVITQDFSPASNYSFTPLVEGSYSIAIYVKDSLSQKDYDDVKNLNFTVLQAAKLSTLLTNKTQYLTGQAVNLTAGATLGSGNYLYKYITSKDGIILSTLDYSYASSLLYNVNNAGTYNITAYMKDALSTKDYDDVSTVSIPVYNQPTMNLTASSSAALIGNAVNYTITELNGSGSAQYRFVVMKDNSTAFDSGFTNSNTLAYTPTVSGTYQVIGYIKDSLSENAYDAQSSTTLNAYNPQLSTVTVNGSFYVGKALSFSANATSVSPNGFSYRYEVYNNGALITSSNFSASSSYSFTPNTAGTFTIKVYGKDGLSTNSYDSIKQFNLTINNKPLYLSTLPLSYGMTSNDVTSLQSALIKLGYALSAPTGYFGTMTKSAVISFQSSNGLSADGVVGNLTYGTLNDTLIQKSGTTSLTF